MAVVQTKSGCGGIDGRGGGYASAGNGDLSPIRVQSARNEADAIAQRDRADENTATADRERKKTEQERVRADEKAKEANDQRKRTEQQLMRAEGMLCASQIRSAQEQFEKRNFDNGMDYLKSCRWDFRGWEHDYILTRYTRGYTDLQVNSGEEITSVAFSPEGKRIVTGGPFGILRIWDATTGQETLAIKGHTAQVASVAFSPDGKRIVSGSFDNTAKI